jgi:hypothetical protein
METQAIELTREKARELWRDYRKHQNWSAPIDREVMHAYQAVAQGKVVIQAIASIATAGLGEDGFPKLALVRADATKCWVRMWQDGSATFAARERAIFDAKQVRNRITLPADSFPRLAPFSNARNQATSIVPLVPIPLRPKRGMANYHILYEALWRPEPPTDPMLLRRVGDGDLWVVVAAWDLTPIERAVMAARIRG